MNKKYITIWILILLAILNFSIYKKEQLIRNGKTLLLKLAPIDPRSIMQGDYIRLNFELANLIRKKTDKKNFDGIVVLLLDKNRVGKFVSFYNKHTKLILKPNYLKLKYKIRNGKVKIVTDSFFFQEEKAKIYQKAKYGKFKVDKEGNAILIGVIDKEFRELK